MLQTRSPILFLLYICTSFAFVSASWADENNCPQAYYNGISMDDEFGPGAQDITDCIGKTDNVNVVIQLDSIHPTVNGNVISKKATFLSTIHKMITNYEVVQGVKIGDKADIVVIASRKGSILMTTHHPAFGTDANGNANANPFRNLVEMGMQKGFRFYVCQSASRANGIDMANKIPGVRFVPGGHIAVADFQLRGYAVVKP